MTRHRCAAFALAVLLVEAVAVAPARAADRACDERSGLEAVKQSFLTGSALPDAGAGACRDQILALRQRVQAVQAGTDGSDAQKKKLLEDIYSVAGLVGQSPPQDVIDSYLVRNNGAHPSGDATRPRSRPASSQPPPSPQTEDAVRAEAAARGNAALDKARADAGAWNTAAPELAAFGASDANAPRGSPLSAPALLPRVQFLPGFLKRSAAPPDPLQPMAQVAAAPSPLDRAATWTYETGLGYAAGVVNWGLGAPDLTNSAVDLVLGLTPIQYRFRTDIDIKAQTRTERYAQNAVAAASMLYGSADALRGAPEIAAVSGSLAAQLGSWVDRTLGRGLKTEPRPLRPVEPVPPGPRTVAAPPPADSSGEGVSWEDATEMLRSISPMKGNVGLGTGTRADAELLGRAWVGPNARLSSDGKAWVSADGLRLYRPPAVKPRIGTVQANFERKIDGQLSRESFTNAHFDVTN